jgi:hypothetical protein
MEPDMLASEDIASAESKMKEVLAKQKEEQRLKSSTGPGGANGASSTIRNTANLRVTSRKIAKPESGTMPQIQFKSVQVKQLDESTLKLRAQVGNDSHDEKPSGINSNKDLSSDRSQGSLNDASAGSSVLAMLSASVHGNEAHNKICKQIKRSQGRAEGNAEDDIVIMVDSLDTSSIQQQQQQSANVASVSDETLASIFVNAQKAAHSIGDLCSTNPKQFWLLVGITCDIFQKADVNSFALQSAIQLMIAVGSCIANRDKYVSCALLFDFALLKIVNVCRQNPAKILHLARVLTAWCPRYGDNRMKLVRELRKLFAEPNGLASSLKFSAPSKSASSSSSDVATSGGMDTFGLPKLPTAHAELYVLVQIMAAIASQETEVTDDSQSSLLNVYASVADYAIRHTVPAIRLAGR